MSLTYSQARDEILELITTAWAPTTFLMIWPDKPAVKPASRTPWARTTIQHLDGSQATLANHSGIRRYQREGVLTVQVFTPAGEGLSRCYDLAKTISDSVEGKSTLGGVWFRDVRINELGVDSDWFQINVRANFTYDEVK